MGTRATAIERRLPLPGDEIVPFPCWQATRAVTIDRAPCDVWPWLVLIMRARVSYTPVWHPALVRLFFASVMSAGDAIEAGGMLRGIRRRVEAAGPPRQAALSSSPAQVQRGTSRNG